MKKIMIFMIILLLIPISSANDINIEQKSYINANPNEEITIIIQPNKQVDEWKWFINDTLQNESSNKFTTKLNKTDGKIIKVYGTNEFENTTPIMWELKSYNDINKSDEKDTPYLFISILIIGISIFIYKKLNHERS